MAASPLTRQRRRMVALSAIPVAAFFALASPAGAAQNPDGPPGNNGTVKIDGVELDNHPDNEPHPGCTFEVDFYGFDRGEGFNADVTFTAQPPTGKGEVLRTDTVFIGEDDNGGGGSEAGHDGEGTYDLTDDLATFTPHPQQGYHVKLTVNADGSQGADTKHKVFWITDCEASSSGTPVIVAGSDTETETGTQSETGASVAGQSESEPGAEVKGLALERPAVAGSQTTAGNQTTPAVDALARTGNETLLLAGLGTLLVGAGQALRGARRRMTRGI